MLAILSLVSLLAFRGPGEGLCTTDECRKAYITRSIANLTDLFSQWVVVNVDSCGKKKPDQLVLAYQLREYYKQKYGIENDAFVKQATEDAFSGKYLAICGNDRKLDNFSSGEQWINQLEQMPLQWVLNTYFDEKRNLKGQYQKHLLPLVHFLYRKQIYVATPDLYRMYYVLPQGMKTVGAARLSTADSTRYRFVKALAAWYNQPGSWAVITLDSCGRHWQELLPLVQLYKEAKQPTGTPAYHNTVESVADYLFWGNNVLDICRGATVKGFKADEAKLAQLKRQPLQQVLTTYFDATRHIKPEYKGLLPELVWYCYLHQVIVLTLPGQTAYYQL